VCAEHKKPAKLLKHLAAIKAAATNKRNPPRVLVFANKIKVGWAGVNYIGVCTGSKSWAGTWGYH
jgi:hypothetical protein